MVALYRDLLDKFPYNPLRIAWHFYGIIMVVPNKLVTMMRQTITLDFQYELELAIITEMPVVSCLYSIYYFTILQLST